MVEWSSEAADHSSDLAVGSGASQRVRDVGLARAGVTQLLVGGCTPRVGVQRRAERVRGNAGLGRVVVASLWAIGTPQ